tara:strand:+ start:522 stop:761 length:240 start_codon:yes stop_codon:yes gene_type:complete
MTVDGWTDADEESLLIYEDDWDIQNPELADIEFKAQAAGGPITYDPSQDPMVEDCPEEPKYSIIEGVIRQTTKNPITRK